ncbi:Hypothetical protein A7982_11115 [Minicystis rosea]|nr:Hypothetical protein A7982_11115 [Minicystis rosea]
MMADEGVVVVSRDESKRDKPLWSTVLLRIDAETARALAAALADAAEAVEPRPSLAKAAYAIVGERSCEEDPRSQCPSTSGVFRRLRRHELRVEIEPEPQRGNEGEEWTSERDRARRSGR